MVVVLQYLVAVAMYGLVRWRLNQTISPDGRNYLIDGWGIPVPSPYQRRWLIGRLIGANVRAWTILTGASIVGAAVMCGTLMGDTPFQRLAGTFLFAGLAGAFTTNVRFPVLVDGPAFFLALFAAWLWSRGHLWLAFIVVCLAGATKESAPIFAALYAWVVTQDPMSLALLGGIGAAGWNRETAKPAKYETWLRDPVGEARSARDVLDWRVMLLPWGSLVMLTPLGIMWMGWHTAIPLLVALFVAHAQLFIANDSARLTAWAAPVAIFFGVRAGIPEALLPMLVLHPIMSHSYKGI